MKGSVFPRFDITPAEAIDLIASATRPAGSETVPLAEAWRRVLAEDLASLADRPSADDSALDGFACRASETAAATPSSPVRLRLVGTSHAGKPFDGVVDPGQAARIATGAAVPVGTDAVVGVEDAGEEDGWVVVRAPAQREAVRRRARDLATGHAYLRAGRRLDAANLGLAAAMGHGAVRVARRPKVALLVTGDELIAPGAGPLRPGEVYDANGASMAALVAAAGAELAGIKRVGDEPDELEAVIATCGEADLIVTSGGVSKGERDAVRDLLHDRGELVFWRVMMRPGGPTMFGSLGGIPLLGMPGNPVSSIVTFLLFVRAYLDTAMGRSGPLPYYDRLRATARSVFSAGAKEFLHRAHLRFEAQGPVVEAFEDQSSAVLRAMTAAGALVVVPPGRRFGPGEANPSVEAIPLAAHLS